MAGEQDLDSIFERLSDQKTDQKSKAQASGELRDNSEFWIQGNLSQFLSRFVPVLLSLLDGPPSLVNDSHQALRNNVLEVFHRFAGREALRPFASRILDKIVSLFKIENEENAVLIIRIFIELQRSHGAILGDRIEAFLNLIIELFQNVENVVNDYFGPDAVAPTGPEKPFARSTSSFKVLSECPITVVSIFQTHKNLLAEHLKRFVPLVKTLLLLQAPQQERAHIAARAKGDIVVGVSKDITNREAFGDLVTLQVKTMSFLAYMLRSNGPLLQDFTATLPDVVSRLLKDCPKEKCATRKELLVAIRHMINFNFRKIFLRALDDLLDERILLGEGLGAAETQKALAYSLLADLVHHLRENLTDAQIRAAVIVYTRHLSDTVPGTSFQTMSAKLLMNMSEKITKMANKQEARLHLMIILDSFADKFAYMNRTHANAAKISAALDHAPSNSDQQPDWDDVDIFAIHPIKAIHTRDRADPIYDNKFLFRNLVLGFKNLFYRLRECNPESPIKPENVPEAIWKEVAYGFGAAEVKVFIKLFHEGIRVFQYYPSEKIQTDAPPMEILGSLSMNTSKEEKDLLETFATIFHQIDPAVFHEIFALEIPHIFELMHEHPALQAIPQFLLASEATSPAFAGMLLDFLMKHIEDVGTADVNRAAILLRLFKLSFMAVTLFANHNENVLLPHIHNLIIRSLDLSTTAEMPMHYFYLLRALFRSIGGGKFEHLYKEILPLLEMLLEKLNNLISCARSTADRDLFVELSLTVPARLSHLLPHLSYLMKPLVLALRAGSELVGQGLRTLELCVDNLTAEYLDPIMAPVIQELMTALYDHLQPSPYSVFHAHTTMRILGKLGGRNRRFLESPKLQYTTEPLGMLSIRLVPSMASHVIPATLGLSQAVEILENKRKLNNDAFYKTQALELLLSQAKLMLQVGSVPNDFAQSLRVQADMLVEGTYDTVPFDVPQDRSLAQREELREIIRGIVAATAYDQMAEQATSFLDDACRHFAVLEIARALAEARADDFELDDGFGIRDQRIIIDVIVDALSSDSPELRSTGERLIHNMREGLACIFGSSDRLLKAPFFSLLLSACCHACHKEEWYSKVGGTRGIRLLLDLFSADLITLKQLEVCRALTYAAKDLVDVVRSSSRTEALDTLILVVRACNSSITKADVLDKETKVHQLCVMMLMETSSTSKPVREVSRGVLAQLAEIAAVPLTELITPIKNNLMRHIFTKPLRSVSEQFQVGYIEAVVFLLENVELTRSDMSRFLTEVATLASQEDDTKFDERHAQNVINLKVSCLHLLSLALDMMDDDDSTDAPKKKPRVIAIFFKALYNKSEQIVDAGNEALKLVVAKENKLPKDILQTGLRPILSSLGEGATLKLAHMTTLARLLLLLKSYFKVEIGARLLENVFKVADQDVLQKASFVHIEQEERIKVLAAVFNVFHLLPEGARDFIPQVVLKAMELEQSLRRTQSSPLREPVCRYLDRYADASWELFSQHLDDTPYSLFFTQLLNQSDGALHGAVLRQKSKLYEGLSHSISSTINTINIVFSLKSKTEVLDEKMRPLLLAADASLKQSLATMPVEQRLPARQARDQLLQIVISYLDARPDIDYLFQIFEAQASNEFLETPYLWHACIYRNILCGSMDTRKAVIKRGIELFSSGNELLKVHVLQLLVIPLVAKNIQDGGELIDKWLVEALRGIWRSESNVDPNKDIPGTEATRMQLLQLTTLILKYCKDVVTDAQREIAKFGFAYIKLEDVLNKYASYVTLAYFFREFETPPKPPHMVYSELIRAHVTEARVLVAQALEVLAPVLKARLKSESNPRPWISTARKPIQADPSLIAQTQNILNFVAKHPQLFFEAREFFTMTIHSFLPRIAPHPITSQDNKRLVLSYMDLIRVWQEDSEPYVSLPTRTFLIKYLATFILTLNERYPVFKPAEQDTCVRAMELFRQLASSWKDIDLTFILPRMEPALNAEPKPEDKSDIKFTQLINSLQLLNSILTVRPHEWVAAHLAPIQRLLEKALRNGHRDVMESLHGQTGSASLLMRVISAAPTERNEDDMEEDDKPDFITFLTSLAADTLTGKNAVAGINIFRSLSHLHPRRIDEFFPALYKTMQGAAKDHFQITLQQAQSREPTAMEQLAQEMVIDLLVKLIDLLGSQITYLGDNRRPYLTILTSIMERSPSKRIHNRILDQLSEWIFSAEPLPNVKEKAAVVLKMIPFAKRDSEFAERFLNIVARVYEDKQTTRSELAVRLEAAFLVGTSSENIALRNRFVRIFDKSLSRSANRRFLYLLAAQDWSELADKFWLGQVIELLCGSVDDVPTRLDFQYELLQIEGDAMVDDKLESFVTHFRRFHSQLVVRSHHILTPLAQLQLVDDKTARIIWRHFFPMFWSILTRDERSEMQEGLVQLMTKEYHQASMDKRPNCIQVIMEAIADVRINFPPHVFKYLAKTYDGWYEGMAYMENNAYHPIVDTAVTKESNLDALAEMYANLEETDMFYGLWRRRCEFQDTLTALSFEQHGDWEKAQKMYEAATLKARTGASPFKQGEYMLWEDHWIRCAQKLQQWDVLSDFAKNDNLNDLFLESIWRQVDFWHSSKENQKQLDHIIKLVGDAPTPRRAFFQSFMALLKLHQVGDQEHSQAFSKLNDDAIQLSIRKWHQLPRRITNAHIPILQSFQQLCELYDAHVISTTLSNTTQSNIDQKAPELKLQLNTWRERLPNFWDDINTWQELVTWRQHVFTLINRKYMTLFPTPPGNVTNNSLAYKGYHETASIINRFAHVARKHNLPDVCIAMLSKIYTLPNIEIQEAFLKLREQAKCHYHNPNELQVGLDVINNTNLNYFAASQKAEFYTLKGMFLAKQNQMQAANDAFGSALYFALRLSKAWAEWARYYDQLFKEDPQDMSRASSAMSCYLEAASCYKNSKSRKFFARILWLLSLDDAKGTLAKIFEEHQAEIPIWYWVTFIPQLLTSISRQEGRVTTQILAKLARSYPQALFFPLRTSREDLQVIRRQAAAAKQESSPAQSSPKNASPRLINSEANGTPKKEDEQIVKKKPWDHLEEITNLLKTAYPLLALSLETMVDQICKHMKLSYDEDAYRLFVALHNDASTYLGRSPNSFSKNTAIPASTEANITRFAATILNGQAQIKKRFVAEFLPEQDKPSLYDYLLLLRKWRDRFEQRLDRRNQTMNLEYFGSLLSDFKFQKFDEVEVPGQYVLHKDSNKDFKRIDHFMPDVDSVKSQQLRSHRLWIKAHDGSLHPFIVQTPVSRSAKRDERMLQMVRFFNDVLNKTRESRRRHLEFTAPATVALSPAYRLVQDDPSYETLQDVFEAYCRKMGIHKDDPFLFMLNKLRDLKPSTFEEAQSIRFQAYQHVQEKYVPKTVMLHHYQATHRDYPDFWLLRRRFTYQLATLSFLNYILSMKDRFPIRMSIALSTGNIWGTDLYPGFSSQHGPRPIFGNSESVPFRLTPNMQMFIGPIALEGIFAPSMLVIAKALTDPASGNRLEQTLSLFVRDEMILWYTGAAGNTLPAGVTKREVDAVALRNLVTVNCDKIVKKAMGLALINKDAPLPINQSVLDLVAKATDPIELAKMDPNWAPWM